MIRTFIGHNMAGREKAEKKTFDSFSKRCRRIQLRKSSDCSSTSARRLCADTSLVFSAYDEYEVSPYEELKLTLVRNIEMSRMASIMAGRFSFQRASHLSSLNSRFKVALL